MAISLYIISNLPIHFRNKKMVLTPFFAIWCQFALICVIFTLYDFTSIYQAHFFQLIFYIQTWWNLINGNSHRKSGFCVILVRLRPFGVNLRHFYATLRHIASQTSSSTFPPSLYNLAVSFKVEKITKKCSFIMKHDIH